MSDRDEIVLNGPQNTAVERIASNHDGLDRLVEVFADPAQAYICSPVPLSFRQLARLYRDSWDEDELHRMPAQLRERSRIERWAEKRTIFQHRRTAARRDAILSEEARVWAIVGIEFHATRLRNLSDRYEALNEYVMRGLEACEAGDQGFSTSLRDACKELSALEEQIVAIMPDLALKERAKQVWESEAGDRNGIIKRIEERYDSLRGAERAADAFEVIRGGLGAEESG